ncbi:unnamed protein product, partial [Choristocarpus tenellus]
RKGAESSSAGGRIVYYKGEDSFCKICSCPGTIHVINPLWETLSSYRLGGMQSLRWRADMTVEDHQCKVDQVAFDRVQKPRETVKLSVYWGLG